MDFIKKYSHYIIAGLGLIAFIFLFFKVAAVKYEGYVLEELNGFQAIFGMKKDGYREFGFSFGGFVFFLLLIITSVLPTVTYFVSAMHKYKDYINFTEAGLLFVTDLLFYLLPIMANPESESLKSYLAGKPCNYIGAAILSISLLFQVYLTVSETKKHK